MKCFNSISHHCLVVLGASAGASAAAATAAFGISSFLLLLLFTFYGVIKSIRLNTRKQQKN